MQTANLSEHKLKPVKSKNNIDTETDENLTAVQLHKLPKVFLIKHELDMVCQSLEKTRKKRQGIADISLHIVYYDQAFFDRIKKSICMDLAYLAFVKSFSFYVRFGDEMDDKKMKSLSDCLKHLTRLQSFKLDFDEGGQSITDEAIEYLSHHIKSLSALKTLDLNLMLCDNITKKWVQALSGTFRYLTSLQNLRLTFPNNEYMNDEAVKILCNGLKSRPTLKSLDLLLWGHHTTNVGAREFGICLESLSELQSISFSLFNCTGITAEGMGILFRGIRCIDSLRKLHLSFFSSEQLADQKMKASSESIKSFFQLRSLEICLNNCIRITDEGLNSISQSLRHLTLLQNINLNFSLCKKITDKGIISLCESLRLLTSLQVITLKMYWCENISDVGIRSLTEALRHLTALQEVDLDLSRCNKVSKAVSEALKQELEARKLKSITICNYPL